MFLDVSDVVSQKMVVDVTATDGNEQVRTFKGVDPLVGMNDYLSAHYFSFREGGRESEMILIPHALVSEIKFYLPDDED